VRADEALQVQGTGAFWALGSATHSLRSCPPPSRPLAPPSLPPLVLEYPVRWFCVKAINVQPPLQHLFLRESLGVGAPRMALRWNELEDDLPPTPGKFSSVLLCLAPFSRG
jgi:hypothetical protein